MQYINVALSNHEKVVPMVYYNIPINIRYANNKIHSKLWTSQINNELFTK